MTAALMASLLMTLAAGSNAIAQTPTITPNYKDADLRQIIEAVSEITGRNFIIDPRVKAQVTMLSSSPMSPDAFYEAFLSILEVHGYVAVPSGDLTKILPDANARQVPGRDLPSGSFGAGDELVTQVIQVQNVGAAQLVPILRPLIPQYGHLAAHPASNMLIISDRAANVNRMLRIIRRIDQAGDEEIEVIRLEHASASDVVRVVTALTQAANRADASASPLGMVADERTNSVLISGDRASRLRIRALVTHLDTPLEQGGNTQVIYLSYADAEDLAGRLRDQAPQITGQAQAGAQQGGAPSSRRKDGVTIWADPATNALVITAPSEAMRMLKSVISQLDIRRAQVLVEAIVAEVSYNKAAQLGVSWVIDGSEGGNIVGLTKFTSALNVTDIGGALVGDDDQIGQALQAIPDGASVGIGDFSGSTRWAAIIRALLGDASTNVLATPSIMTLDNEEAELSVGQEVPFVTGQFTNTGAAQGSVNPFQTIQREDVGLKLKVTPQINEGDALILEIQLENSNLQASTQGAVDLVTNERTITQKVLVENGQVLVMGGLVDDQVVEIDEKVPFLGDIPFMGNLFKSQSSTVTKRTLMVFLRPVIVRDEKTATNLTNTKYRLMRNVQLGEREEGDVLMMKDLRRPVMPELPEGGLPPETPTGIMGRDPSVYPTVKPDGEGPTSGAESETPTETEESEESRSGLETGS
ncbi:MAG: type II secretion system secretin GspD [Gammaproteobacteria bacterium]|nr:MAG: type II secretion system secretin GspD [Gammaproteobacteria bacterium]